MAMPEPDEPLELSVVAAAHNEEDNVGRLVTEIAAALDPTGRAYEIVVVDDGSTDRTLEVLTGAQQTRPYLRVLRMLNTPGRPGRGLGQSAAFAAGIRVARGNLVCLIDADLQNDPADIPGLLVALEEAGADVVQGDRRGRRQDTFVRRASSLVGRLTRRALLGDTIGDTGCSLRLLRCEAARALPLDYRGMHRFIPVTCRQLGYTNIRFRCGDGTRGWPEHAAYDAIQVAAAREEIPSALRDQLAVGGRLVIPLGAAGAAQMLVMIERTGPENFQQRNLGPVAFVPLIGGES